MKRILVFCFSLFTFTILAFPVSQKVTKIAEKSLQFSAQQYSLMAEVMKDKPNLLPRTIDDSGKLITSKANWWTSGFFPGTLWYLAEYTKNEKIRTDAELMSQRVANQQYVTNNHDVGFMIYCSYGNGYRLYPTDEYKNIIINTARSLSTRFNPKVGLIRSWDHGKWQYPVIIDNMMNLELLFNATKFSGDSSFYNIAVAHANKTMINHFRSDASSYHLVSYNPMTGIPELKGTVQGYSDSSSWARGQAWALYGYTMCYRETNDIIFLKHALRIADFLLSNPRMPNDLIPYWDFDAPNIPNALRDASAGAIMCSAFIELSGYVKGKESKRFLKAAEKQILTLSSPQYQAKLGENGNFILKHSVGSFPHNAEMDVPLTYADYYYVEALMRYIHLNEKVKK
ncbi:MAG: glucuronyl hydrolase [Paludibacter sp.]|nr:glucuronyl hydrolase [Paludibacter sp.]